MFWVEKLVASFAAVFFVGRILPPTTLDGKCSSVPLLWLTPSSLEKKYKLPEQRKLQVTVVHFAS